MERSTFNLPPSKVRVLLLNMPGGHSGIIPETVEENHNGEHDSSTLTLFRDSLVAAAPHAHHFQPADRCIRASPPTNVGDFPEDWMTRMSRIISNFADMYPFAAYVSEHSISTSRPLFRDCSHSGDL